MLNGKDKKETRVLPNGVLVSLLIFDASSYDHRRFMLDLESILLRYSVVMHCPSFARQLQFSKIVLFRRQHKH